MAREQGHHLLKRLGKTKLRPGGIKATNWLFDKIPFTKDIVILEVACNEGSHLRQFAKTHKNLNYGIDNNAEWLNKGIEKVKEEGLEDLVKLQIGNAMDLPFEDNTFDVVINEAMLTMLGPVEKEKALTEYYRVLKPGGILLTHDVRQVKEDKDEIKKLQYVLNIPALPLTKENWLDLMKETGFKNMECETGEMTLLSSEGLAADEGEEGKMKIMENALRDENREQFLEMLDFFTKAKDNLYYIAIKTEK